MYQYGNHEVIKTQGRSQGETTVLASSFPQSKCCLALLKNIGEPPPPPPLESYSGKSGTYPAKFENILANLKMKTFLFLEIKLILITLIL